MFFSTVSHGKIAYCWNTTPRRASGPVTCSPSTSTSPESVCRKPAARLSSVDFPQPLGPSTLTNSPLRTPKSTPSSTSTRFLAWPKPRRTSVKLIRSTVWS